jgi:uncharacterized membrane protein YeiH
MLLGQPPSWMLHHASTVSMLLAWWLTYCCPLDLHWSVASSLSPSVLEALGVVAAISSGHAMTTWGVDKAMFNDFHTNPLLIRNSFVVCVCCGVLSSTGGGLLGDAMGVFKKNSFCLTNEPMAIFSTGSAGHEFRAKVAKMFLLSTIYYLVMNNYFFILYKNGVSEYPQQEVGVVEQKMFGHLLICSIMVASWLSSILVPNVDLISLISSVIKRSLLIPGTVIPCTTPAAAAVAARPQQGNDVGPQRPSGRKRKKK